MGLKHWLSNAEYAALDADARSQYVDYGDGYRLDPKRRDLREQKERNDRFATARGNLFGRWCVRDRGTTTR
jgi:hypothetical protein